MITFVLQRIIKIDISFLNLYQKKILLINKTDIQIEKFNFDVKPWCLVHFFYFNCAKLYFVFCSLAQSSVRSVAALSPRFILQGIAKNDN
jgi:hypothetical protein